jgi:2-iminobutanoate/2-iminopropanoate deaminase
VTALEDQPTAKTIVRPPGLVSSPAFNHGVSKAGNIVYIAGQLPMTADGEVVGAGDIDAQSEQVWSQIRATVEAAGGSMTDLVKITTYITDIADVGAVIESRLGQFPPGEVPASALLVVKSLARAEFLVEIEAVAVI